MKQLPLIIQEANQLSDFEREAAELDADLKPTYYCEIGGNPSGWKIKELTKLILKQAGVNQLAVIDQVVESI